MTDGDGTILSTFYVDKIVPSPLVPLRHDRQPRLSPFRFEIGQRDGSPVQ